MAGMKTLMLATLIAAFLFSVPCQAETAEEMMSSCRDLSTVKVRDANVQLPQDFDSGVCWGSFAMVQKMTRVVHLENGVYVPTFGLCAPEESTRTQLIQVFEQYATKHPERLHEEFWSVVQTALREAFPCKT